MISDDKNGHAGLEGHASRAGHIPGSRLQDCKTARLLDKLIK
jgi:hypothetical protein